MLAQNPNDLLFGKPASPHHSSPSDELTYQWHEFWGAGHIGWSQLMETCKAVGKDAILVTDDGKEDWWHLEKSWTISPRPELLQEFSEVTGRNVWIYNSEGFLRAAQQFNKVELSDTALAEVKETGEAVRYSRVLVSQKPEVENVQPSDDLKVATPSDKMIQIEKES